MARRPNAQYGTWRVILKSGAEFTFNGAVRYHRDADGFVEDIDIEGRGIGLQPGFSDIACVLVADIPSSAQSKENR